MRTKLIIATLVTASIVIGGGLLVKAATSQSNPTDKEIARLEKLAEKGDMDAVRSLILHYDSIAEPEMVEVVEVIECEGYEDDGTPIYGEPYKPEPTEQETNPLNEYNNERLNHWLDVALVKNDTLAYRVKGMRLYYSDEAAAIDLLSKSADAGNIQSALFCGSACFNQYDTDPKYGMMAVKYLTQAYNAGVPSAGWHLSMCYGNGIGTDVDIDKAWECLKHSAELDCEEAVLEMLRSGQDREYWSNKAKKLGLID